MINPSNVIDLAETLLDRGEANFALCPHCGDHSSFAPIVRRNTKGNYITALLCLGPKCKGILGQYNVLFSQLGQDSANHPAELLYGLIKSGFNTLCYDGQYFFDTDHPVVDANGVTQSVSNFGGGAGNPWYLFDTTKVIKPFIFQKRQDYKFVALDNPDDPNVFNKKEYVFGVDARCNVGFGLWQLAYASRQGLTAANYATGRSAMMSVQSDNGQPLGIVPNLLVVGPSNEAAAREIATAERNAAGATNVWRGTVEVLVVPWLP